MKRVLWLPFLVIFTSSVITAGDKIEWENVKIITEDLAPLGYIDKKDNQLKGETVEHVKKAIRYLDLSNKIEVYPWARALNMAQNHENVFIFNLARIPDREKKFQWVFKTKTKRVGAFALKNRKDIQIKKIDDLRKYRIVVINQNIVHLLLLGKGFDQGKEEYFHPMSSELQIIQFLYSRRADIWIKTYLTDNETDEKIKEAGKDPKELEKKFDIKEMKLDLYLATSLKTSKDKIQKFKEAMQIVKP